ncbi:MAG: DNA internalization-related competence protein ComEC/Rec2 [Acidaminococcaceae bacterium]
MAYSLYASLLFCLGDYFGICNRQFLSLTGVLSSFVLLVILNLYFYHKIQNLKAYICLSAVLIFVCGWAVGVAGSRRGANYIEQYLNQEIMVSGTIIPGTVKELEDDAISLRMDCKLIKQGEKTFTVNGILRLVIAKVPRNSQIRTLGYGRLNVQGEIKPIRGFANPGVFDTEMAAKVQGIGGRMSARAEQVRYIVMPRPWSSYPAEAANLMRAQLKKVMPEKDAAILGGMTLGGYDGIDEDTVKKFSATGIVHILSVSGSHVALLIGFVLSLLSFLHVRKKLSLVIAAGTVIGYCLICGFSPPVLRSALMGMAMLLGLALQRNEDSGAVLAIVAISILCYKPMWVLDIGFQLSFASTAGLIYLFPSVKAWLAQYMRKYFAAALAVTIAAQLAVLPLLVYYFHQVSISSLAANIIVVPVMEFIVLLTMAGLFLSFLCKPLGIILLMFASLLLTPALAATKWIAAWPFASIIIAHKPFIMALAYYLLLISLFRIWPFETLDLQERKLVVALTCFAIFLPIITMHFARQPFTVYFIDVGQGDAALVITEDKKTILIDAGGLRGNYDTGERIVLPFLRYLGIDKLDVLALSHGHHDHAGGAAAVARSIPIGCVLLTQEEPSQDVSVLLNFVKNKSRIKYLNGGQQYNLGSCQIAVIEAPTTAAFAEKHNENESSAIMKITDGAKSIVFTGDATEEEEIAASAGSVKADVLKVAHHGSKTSSSFEFLQAVKPRLAVISVGSDNKFGHPAPETLEKLQEIGVKILRTDHAGNIKVVFDGSNCTWYSYRYQGKYF